MASLPVGSVDYFLNKRHLPSSQVERVPDIEELEDEEQDFGVAPSSLRSANFMPPGHDYGMFESPLAAAPSLQSPLFSPIYQELGRISASKLGEKSEKAEALRKKLLRNSNVLVVQGGYSGKKFIYDRLQSLGVNVTIMDGPDSFWKTEAEEGRLHGFIEIDFSETSTVFQRALENAAMVNTKFDAVTTYYEDAVPLATRLAYALGFDLNPVEACDIARNKRKTREALKARGLPSPAFYPIHSERDLDPAIKTVGFPAVLKPAYGAASLGVFRVEDADEAKRMYAEIMETLKPELDPIWTQGTEILMEEFYDGDEFDVDILLFEGKAVYAKLADNWKCWEPWFQETAGNMPSLFPEPAAQELIELAVNSTLAVGFRYGAFHVEVKWTSRGPRLIEINARMGGVSVRSSNLEAWGVDLVEQHCMAMLNIPINPIVPEKPLKMQMSLGLLCPYDGKVASDTWLEGIREDKRVIFISYEKSVGETVSGPKANLPDWLGEVRALFQTKEEMVEFLESKIMTLQVPVEPKDKEDARDAKFFLPTEHFPFAPSTYEVTHRDARNGSA